ncbi:alpha/beta-hydrolase [Meredithblackwellia eburnea MCA 4105]
MPSSLVEINGRQLFVETTGSGPKPFIAMHGLGGSTNLFPIAQPLVDAGFTVIRFDFEGAGKSPLASTTLTIDRFVEDVKAVLEFAGFGKHKATIFGHSLGAAVGLHFSATYPDLVEALVLSCPGVARKGNPEGEAASHALAATARDKTPYNMADFTAMKNTAPNSSFTARALVRSAMQESSAEGYARTCEMMAKTDSPDWSKIVTKVLIIAGLHDAISSVQAAETIKGCLTSAESSRVEAVEAGHQPAVECPETVLSLMKEFLAV